MRYLPKLCGKCGTNNKLHFTIVPLVPQLVPHYRIFRRPFSKPEILAEIMHVPLDLILDLQTIFEVLDGGFIVDAEEFRKFTKSWLTKFHGSSYSWNWLCPTMHFVMHHGWEVRKELKIREKLKKLKIGEKLKIN